jgi:hypothetical protein
MDLDTYNCTYPFISQADFAKSVADNAELATAYHTLQCELIDIKTQALKVIETRLKLETSLRDYQQV